MLDVDIERELAMSLIVYSADDSRRSGHPFQIVLQCCCM